eukprot:gene16072-17694_t
MDEKEEVNLFTKAAEYVRSLKNLDQSTMLTLYGFYKQATIGKCNVGKPAFWDFVGKSKWESWNKLGSMECSDAKSKYVTLVQELDPQWDKKSTSQTTSKKVTGTGVAVSKFCCTDDEIVKDDEKTVFDWCKEGNIQEVSRIASSQDFNINSLDNNVQILKIQIIEDSELQTPLHYAAVCENEDIVKQLLNAGANPEIKDDAGLTPIQSTSSNLIRNIFTSHHSQSDINND